MKPLIIIPDENQKTITMTIEDFKKTINDVWEQAYKEGQSNQLSWLTPYIPYTTGNTKITSTPSTTTPSSISSNIDNKRTFEKTEASFEKTEASIQTPSSIYATINKLDNACKVANVW